MPMANEMPDELDPLKLLLIGNTKAGKTHYLLDAAEAGYNVLYINGDIGARTMRKMFTAGELSESAAARICYLSVADYIDESGSYVSFMADFFVKFCTSGKFMWNDSLQRPFSISDYKPEDGHVVWEFYPARIRTDTLIILDSYTALVTSVLNWKADSLGEDLGDIEKIGRDVYQGSGHKLNHFLQLLKAIRAHLGVIAHSREYVMLEKPKGKIGSIAEKDMKIKDTQMVPVSSSNPHAVTIGKNFTDIGWLEVDAMGNRVIDFKPSGDKMIGGALNLRGPTSQYPFQRLCELSGHAKPVPTPMDSWLKRYGPGEYELPTRTAPVLGANKAQSTQAPATIRTGSLSALTARSPSLTPDTQKET